MPEVLFEIQSGDEDETGFAVEAIGREHHLASKDVVEFGRIKELPVTGLVTVNDQKILVSFLQFSIRGCSPSMNRAEAQSCNGMGIIPASEQSTLVSSGQSAIRVGDEGFCLGMGTLGGYPVPVHCSVKIGRSCQRSFRPLPGQVAEPETPGSVPQTEYQFKVILSHSDGQPVAGARYCAKTATGYECAGNLNDLGEARFTMPAPTCHLDFPEYDASMILRSSNSQDKSNQDG